MKEQPAIVSVFIPYFAEDGISYVFMENCSFFCSGINFYAYLFPQEEKLSIGPLLKNELDKKIIETVYMCPLTKTFVFSGISVQLQCCSDAGV